MKPTTTPAAEQPASQRYWRSIAERHGAAEARLARENEFTGYDPDALLKMPRRSFMAVAGAAMALAGVTLAGCRRWPQEQLAPFNNRPEDLVPGLPMLYASAIERAGVASPVMVVAVDGRPIKVEAHAARLDGRPRFGAPFIFDQAEVLSMYDPDRLRQVRQGRGDASSPKDWGAFEQELRARQAGDGAGVVVLSEAHSGPTMKRLKAAFLKAYPKAKWVVWEPTGRWNQAEGLRLAGAAKTLRPLLQLEQARVIAAFDADTLNLHPAGTLQARGWAAGRAKADTIKETKGDAAAMPRLYAIEPSLTLTGTNADERLAVKPSQVGTILAAVAHAAGVAGVDAVAGLEAEEAAFVQRLARDLKAAHGAAVVEVGFGQPPAVHALAAALNQHLGALGKTLRYIEEPSDIAGPAPLAELAKALEAGQVEALYVLGGNPAFDAPADLKLGAAIAKAKWSAHLTESVNETTRACDWALPKAHAFEAWGDAVTWDGLVAVSQPQILPLFGGRSSVEIAALLAGEIADAAGYDAVRKTFRGLLPGAFERNWRAAVQAGFTESAAAAETALEAKAPAFVPAKPGALEISFRHTGPLFDGRFANNSWLQELPQAVSKATWDNPLFVGVADAEAHGLTNGDLVTVKTTAGSLRLPVFVVPGQPAGVLAVASGYGRRVGGRVGGLDESGASVGFDTYALRSAEAFGFAAAESALAKEGEYRLAFTQVHHLLRTGQDLHIPFTKKDDLHPEGRTPTDFMLEHRIGQPSGSGQHGDILREWTLAEYLGGEQAGRKGNVRLQLFQEPKEGAGATDLHQWGMAIDNNKCTGCSLCMVSCQAENNIPSVGKDQVWRSREMHWIRVDTYYKGDPKATSSKGLEASHMPVTCVQCENAPCEQVCPANATVHDTEGLNTMVYNRCIGTRYCSDNCPYKVRRYNYFDFHSKPVRRDVALPWLNIPDTQQNSVLEEIRKMSFNPEVTVRMRGVMEKCTWCTQRVVRAKVAARAEWAAGQRGEIADARATPEVLPGEVQTACQNACPTGAIVFGNLKDPNSEVRKLQEKNARAWGLLDDIFNTRPRVKHLSRIRNPGEETIKARHARFGADEHGHGHGHDDHGHAAPPAAGTPAKDPHAH